MYLGSYKIFFILGPDGGRLNSRRRTPEAGLSDANIPLFFNKIALL